MKILNDYYQNYNSKYHDYQSRYVSTRKCDHYTKEFVNSDTL